MQHLRKDDFCVMAIDIDKVLYSLDCNGFQTEKQENHLHWLMALRRLYAVFFFWTTQAFSVSFLKSSLYRIDMKIKPVIENGLKFGIIIINGSKISVHRFITSTLFRMVKE